jgi:predicted lipoprotein with Yx(FWY)xxD motif
VGHIRPAIAEVRMLDPQFYQWPVVRTGEVSMNISTAFRFQGLIPGQTKSSRLFVILALGLALALLFGRPANAQSTVNCAAPVTSAPTGPAIVSVASTSYGTVLVEGSAAYAGCSLYVLTSDELRTLTTGAEPFACSNNQNVLGAPCDSVLWPALLTNGTPIAGPGVNPRLLGTVTRTDVLSGQSVQQVTYAGLPLYRFFLDETPGETEGANLFDPVTSPTGIWYLVEPTRGHPATGRARLVLETAPVTGTGPDRTVLAVAMDTDLSLAPNTTFPVYTLITEGDDGQDNPWGQRLACNGICAAVPWPPVLTSMLPAAGPGVDQQDLGTIVRPDGTRQVTYRGHAVYLFYGDAYIPGVTGTQGIYGNGKITPWGVFKTVPPSP